MSKKGNLRYSKLIGFSVVFLLLALVPLIVKSPYHLHLLIMAGMNIVLAMTFVMMLRTGLISLAIAAFWGLGAYASTLLVMRGGCAFG